MNPELEAKPVKSIHGQTHFFCKACMTSVPVAFRVTGQSPSPYDNAMIYWDYIVGECKHTLKDWSH
jgi:hypothetical protein